MVLSLNRSISSRYFGIECLLMSLLWLCCLTIFVSLSYFILQTTVDFIPKHEQRNNIINLRPEHVENENCDLFNGRWVPELRGLLYTNQSCSTIPNSKNCGKHGRKDTDYMNWRWKPYGCELQKFDAKTFLSIVRGKTLAFIGDSVARNQMESLLCLLSQEVTSIDMYKDFDDRFRTWYFPSHNFTMKVIWTKFFVMAEERVMNGTQTGLYDLQLDKLDINWTNKLPGVDIVIISNGHWFFRQIYLYEHGNIKACIYCDAENISNVSPGFAVQKTFRLALKYINDCKECGKLLTLLRTFAPAHLENGSWNTGGSCNRTHPYSEKQINLGGSEWTLRNIQVQEIERRKKKGERRGKRFGHMDVTKAMLMRPDGHPDIHWDNQWMHGYSDCVHWCLPGPIDVWNDLLMAVLRKEDNIFLDDSREEA